MAFQALVGVDRKFALSRSAVCERTRRVSRVRRFAEEDDKLKRPENAAADVLREDEDEILLGLEDFLSEEERRLERPKDPNEIRTESERRRSKPKQRKLRRKRRAPSAVDELDWDKMESRPLVKKNADPRTGEDYWIDMTLKREPRKRKSKPVDSKLREKLKQETASPYKNNWIGIIVVIVFVLVVLYNVLPNQTPIIPIPDL